MAFRGGKYQACATCSLVLLSGQLKQHAEKCDGFLRPRSAKNRKKTREKPEYSEATRTFLAKKAHDFNGKPFNIVCQNCKTTCNFNVDSAANLSTEDFVRAFEEHYKAVGVDVGDATKEARAMSRKLVELEQATEIALEKRLQERDGTIRKEVAEYQVTDIPDGIRQHPYRRDRLPTLEVMLLWEDPSNGSVRGRCLFTMPHPEVPKLEDVDDIFAEIEPFFAKRWLKVQLALETPQQGDFAETPPDLGGLPLSGADVMVLACHPRGFASEASESVVHVSQCQPLSFKAKTDDAGQAQICFLPASLNKVQVTETAVFHGTEVSLMGSELKSLDEGVTNLTVRLLPKAQASLSVHVFCMPKKMPEATEEMFGIINWAAEDRQAIPAAKVDVTPLETNGMQLSLQHTAEDSFEASLAEGCFSVKVACDGYETEERTLMLLVGPNHVYFPMVPRSVNVE